MKRKEDNQEWKRLFLFFVLALFLIPPQAYAPEEQFDWQNDNLDNVPTARLSQAISSGELPPERYKELTSDQWRSVPHNNVPEGNIHLIPPDVVRVEELTGSKRKKLTADQLSHGDNLEKIENLASANTDAVTAAINTRYAVHVSPIISGLRLVGSTLYHPSFFKSQKGLPLDQFSGSGIPITVLEQSALGGTQHTHGFVFGNADQAVTVDATGDARVEAIYLEKGKVVIKVGGKTTEVEKGVHVFQDAAGHYFVVHEGEGITYQGVRVQSNKEQGEIRLGDTTMTIEGAADINVKAGTDMERLDTTVPFAARTQADSSLTITFADGKPTQASSSQNVRLDAYGVVDGKHIKIGVLEGGFDYFVHPEPAVASFQLKDDNSAYKLVGTDGKINPDQTIKSRSRVNVYYNKDGVIPLEGAALALLPKLIYGSERFAERIAEQGRDTPDFSFDFLLPDKNGNLVPRTLTCGFGRCTYMLDGKEIEAPMRTEDIGDYLIERRDDMKRMLEGMLHNPSVHVAVATGEAQPRIKDIAGLGVAEIHDGFKGEFRSTSPMSVFSIDDEGRADERGPGAYIDVYAGTIREVGWDNFFEYDQYVNIGDGVGEHEHAEIRYEYRNNQDGGSDVWVDLSSSEFGDIDADALSSYLQKDVTLFSDNRIVVDRDFFVVAKLSQDKIIESENTHITDVDAATIAQVRDKVQQARAIVDRTWNILQFDKGIVNSDGVNRLAAALLRGGVDVSDDVSQGIADEVVSFVPEDAIERDILGLSSPQDSPQDPTEVSDVWKAVREDLPEYAQVLNAIELAAQADATDDRFKKEELNDQAIKELRKYYSETMNHVTVAKAAYDILHDDDPVELLSHMKDITLLAGSQIETPDESQETNAQGTTEGTGTPQQTEDKQDSPEQTDSLELIQIALLRSQTIGELYGPAKQREELVAIRERLTKLAATGAINEDAAQQITQMIDAQRTESFVKEIAGDFDDPEARARIADLAAGRDRKDAGWEERRELWNTLTKEQQLAIQGKSTIADLNYRSSYDASDVETYETALLQLRAAGEDIAPDAYLVGHGVYGANGDDYNAQLALRSAQDKILAIANRNDEANFLATLNQINKLSLASMSNAETPSALVGALDVAQATSVDFSLNRQQEQVIGMQKARILTDELGDERRALSTLVELQKHNSYAVDDLFGRAQESARLDDGFYEDDPWRRMHYMTSYKGLLAVYDNEQQVQSMIESLAQDDAIKELKNSDSADERLLYQSAVLFGGLEGNVETELLKIIAYAPDDATVRAGMEIQKIIDIKKANTEFIDPAKPSLISDDDLITSLRTFRSLGSNDPTMQAREEKVIDEAKRRIVEYAPIIGPNPDRERIAEYSEMIEYLPEEDAKEIQRDIVVGVRENINHALSSYLNEHTSAEQIRNLQSVESSVELLTNLPDGLEATANVYDFISDRYKGLSDHISSKTEGWRAQAAALLATEAALEVQEENGRQVAIGWNQVRQKKAILDQLIEAQRSTSQEMRTKAIIRAAEKADRAELHDDFDLFVQGSSLDDTVIQQVQNIIDPNWRAKSAAQRFHETGDASVMGQLSPEEVPVAIRFSQDLSLDNVKEQKEAELRAARRRVEAGATLDTLLDNANLPGHIYEDFSRITSSDANGLSKTVGYVGSILGNSMSFVDNTIGLGGRIARNIGSDIGVSDSSYENDLKGLDPLKEKTAAAGKGVDAIKGMSLQQRADMSMAVFEENNRQALFHVIQSGTSLRDAGDAMEGIEEVFSMTNGDIGVNLIDPVATSEADRMYTAIAQQQFFNREQAQKIMETRMGRIRVDTETGDYGSGWTNIFQPFTFAGDAIEAGINWFDSGDAVLGDSANRITELEAENNRLEWMKSDLVTGMSVDSMLPGYDDVVRNSWTLSRARGQQLLAEGKTDEANEMFGLSYASLANSAFEREAFDDAVAYANEGAQYGERFERYANNLETGVIAINGIDSLQEGVEGVANIAAFSIGIGEAFKGISGFSQGLKGVGLTESTTSSALQKWGYNAGATASKVKGVKWTVDTVGKGVSKAKSVMQTGTDALGNMPGIRRFKGTASDTLTTDALKALDDTLEKAQSKLATTKNPLTRTQLENDIASVKNARTTIQESQAAGNPSLTSQARSAKNLAKAVDQGVDSLSLWGSTKQAFAPGINFYFPRRVEHFMEWAQEGLEGAVETAGLQGADFYSPAVGLFGGRTSKSQSETSSETTTTTTIAEALGDSQLDVDGRRAIIQGEESRLDIGVHDLDPTLVPEMIILHEDGSIDLDTTVKLRAAAARIPFMGVTTTSPIQQANLEREQALAESQAIESAAAQLSAEAEEIAIEDAHEQARVIRLTANTNYANALTDAAINIQQDAESAKAERTDLQKTLLATLHLYGHMSDTDFDYLSSIDPSDIDQDYLDVILFEQVDNGWVTDLQKELADKKVQVARTEMTAAEVLAAAKNTETQYAMDSVGVVAVPSIRPSIDGLIGAVEIDLSPELEPMPTPTPAPVELPTPLTDIAETLQRYGTLLAIQRGLVTDEGKFLVSKPGEGQFLTEDNYDSELQRMRDNLRSSAVALEAHGMVDEAGQINSLVEEMDHMRRNRDFDNMGLTLENMGKRELLPLSTSIAAQATAPVPVTPSLPAVITQTLALTEPDTASLLIAPLETAQSLADLEASLAEIEFEYDVKGMPLPQEFFDLSQEIALRNSIAAQVPHRIAVEEASLDLQGAIALRNSVYNAPDVAEISERAFNIRAQAQLHMAGLDNLDLDTIDGMAALQAASYVDERSLIGAGATASLLGEYASQNLFDEMSENAARISLFGAAENDFINARAPLGFDFNPLAEMNFDPSVEEEASLDDAAALIVMPQSFDAPSPIAAAIIEEQRGPAVIDLPLPESLTSIGSRLQREGNLLAIQGGGRPGEGQYFAVDDYDSKLQRMRDSLRSSANELKSHGLSAQATQLSQIADEMDHMRRKKDFDNMGMTMQSMGESIQEIATNLNTRGTPLVLSVPAVPAVVPAYTSSDDIIDVEFTVIDTPEVTMPSPAAEALLSSEQMALAQRLEAIGLDTAAAQHAAVALDLEANQASASVSIEDTVSLLPSELAGEVRTELVHTYMDHNGLMDRGRVGTRTTPNMHPTMVEHAREAGVAPTTYRQMLSSPETPYAFGTDSLGRFYYRDSSGRRVSHGTVVNDVRATVEERTRAQTGATVPAIVTFDQTSQTDQSTATQEPIAPIEEDNDLEDIVLDTSTPEQDTDPIAEQEETTSTPEQRAAKRAVVFDASARTIFAGVSEASDVMDFYNLYSGQDGQTEQESAQTLSDEPDPVVVERFDRLQAVAGEFGGFVFSNGYWIQFANANSPSDGNVRFYVNLDGSQAIDPTYGFFRTVIDAAQAQGVPLTMKTTNKASELEKRKDNTVIYVSPEHATAMQDILRDISTRNPSWFSAGSPLFTAPIATGISAAFSPPNGGSFGQMVSEASMAVKKSLGEGATFENFQQELREEFERRGVAPEAPYLHVNTPDPFDLDVEITQEEPVDTDGQDVVSDISDYDSYTYSDLETLTRQRLGASASDQAVDAEIRKILGDVIVQRYFNPYAGATQSARLAQLELINNFLATFSAATELALAVDVLARAEFSDGDTKLDPATYQRRAAAMMRAHIDNKFPIIVNKPTSDEWKEQVIILTGEDISVLQKYDSNTKKGVLQLLVNKKTITASALLLALSSLFDYSESTSPFDPLAVDPGDTLVTGAGTLEVSDATGDGVTGLIIPIEGDGSATPADIVRTRQSSIPPLTNDKLFPDSYYTCQHRELVTHVKTSSSWNDVHVGDIVQYDGSAHLVRSVDEQKPRVIQLEKVSDKTTRLVVGSGPLPDAVVRQSCMVDFRVVFKEGEAET